MNETAPAIRLHSTAQAKCSSILAVTTGKLSIESIEVSLLFFAIARSQQNMGKLNKFQNNLSRECLSHMDVALLDAR